MATKPATTVPAFHFFTSSMLHWRADDDRAECERMQREADADSKFVNPNGFNVWKVPGPCATTFYAISYYTPQVAGAEFIEFVPYVSEKELPPKRLRHPRVRKVTKKMSKE